jgi:hypothetical protein
MAVFLADEVLSGNADAAIGCRRGLERRSA